MRSYKADLFSTSQAYFESLNKNINLGFGGWNTIEQCCIVVLSDYIKYLGMSRQVRET